MIDWDHAPAWATFKVLDPNGWVYWFERTPIATPTGWFTIGKLQLAGRPDWKNSIEIRPVDNKKDL